MQILKEKFGELPEDLTVAITNSDLQTLEGIIKNIFEFKDVGEVRKFIR